MKKQNLIPLRRLAAALLATLMLAGCVQQPPAQTTLSTEPVQSDPTQPSQPTQTSQTEQTEPSRPSESEYTEPTPTQPTQPTQPPPSIDPVTDLKCTNWKTFPELLSLGDGLVLASRNYYNPGQGIINSMEIIDVYADKVVANTSKGHTLEPVLQRFSDNAIVMAEPDTGKFHIYDRELKLLKSFSAPNVEGFFSYDRKNYYYVANDVLYRMDVASGNVGKMALEQNLRLESLLSIHHDEELLVARVYLSAHSTDCGIAIIDARTGKLRLLSQNLSHVWLSGDMFYGVEMNSSVYGYDLYYGKLSGGAVQRITTDQLGGDKVGYSVLPESNYLVRRMAPDEGERNTTIFDLANGAAAVDMTDYGFQDAVFGTIYLADEQLILGFHAEGYYFNMVLLDPKVLSFESVLTPETVQWQDRVDMTVAQNYLAEVSGPALPDTLKDVRTQADALEKKYGVEILIGQQTVPTCAHSDYSVAYTEDPVQLQAALGRLDAALALYPAGMLKQFRNGAGEGGLSFCLTGSIDGDLPTVGFAQLCRSRYELVLDITADDLDKTIHHELWHAIEMRLSTDTFDTKQWNACNPSGFTYYGKYDTGYRQLTKWTYSGGDGENSYFVDPYARINGREDRARIMEEVMTGSGEALVKASALKKKLRIMADAIRAGFDADGWTDVYWEQYL